MIGVRGERTGQYLSNLGFIEGKHFQVIGCPSMYAFGDSLSREKSMDQYDLNINRDSKISINASSISTDQAIRFLHKVRKEHNNHYFLPQREAELWTLYAGLTSKKESHSSLYPMSIDSEVYQEDRVKYFLHPQSWLNYLKDMDFSVGCRLHGNVAAIQAGTPALFIVHDSRMLELARYHKLPYVMANEINPESSLEEIIPQVDFTAMRKQQKENFERFRAFLDINEIDHIYNHYQMGDKVPFDFAMEKMELPESVPSVIHCNQSEQAMRMYEIFDARKKWDAERIKDQRNHFLEKNASTRENLQKKIDSGKKELQSLKERYDYLNHTTIKTDAKQLGRKLKEKLKGQMGDNYSRIHK